MNKEQLLKNWWFRMTGGPDFITGELLFSTAIHDADNHDKLLGFIDEYGSLSWISNPFHDLQRDWEKK